MIDNESIFINNEMLNLITEIDEFKEVWQPSQHSAKKFDTASLGNEQETAGYTAVCEKIFARYDSLPFSEETIKDFHSGLLQYVFPAAEHRGKYKTLHSRNEKFDAQGKRIGGIIRAITPYETPVKMRELVQWANAAMEEKKLHPLIIIGIFNVVFQAIHPFQDGNQRLSQLLTTFLLLKNGYLYVPYSSFADAIGSGNSEILQKTKQGWLDNKPDWTPWLLCFLQGLKRQKDRLLAKLESEKITK